jgi:hypothetical protein
MYSGYRRDQTEGVVVFLPHQIVGQMLNERFDEGVRRNYFRGMEFAVPVGDPGWFGPGSELTFG